MEGHFLNQGWVTGFMDPSSDCECHLLEGYSASATPASKSHGWVRKCRFQTADSYITVLGNM